MLKCAKCGEEAEYKVVKRFNLLRIKPLYLCATHRRKFETTQDIVIMAALAASLIACIVSLPRHAPPPPPTPPVAGGLPAAGALDPRDLDGDGYVSWWEAHVTGDQLVNFQKIGYPFEQLLHEGEPTKAVRKRIDVAAFIAAAHPAAEGAESIAAIFNHPKLMQRFVDKYADPAAPLQLHGVYLTTDLYAAFLLLDSANAANSVICLEKITAAQEAALNRLSATGAKADGKRKRKG
jgi:hypothetical protein